MGETSTDDRELVRRAKAGELAAFEQLVTQYERRVYTLARRITRHEQDAEDVTQQALVSAVEHLHEFREESSFATWLMRIATHAALKVLRKRRGLELVSLDEATEPAADGESVPHPEYIADWSASPGELAMRQETQQLLDQALARLDQKHRLVFLLRDVEGLSVRETAAALDLTEANAKVRLLRARLQLREQLTRVFGDERRRVPPANHQHH